MSPNFSEKGGFFLIADLAEEGIAVWAPQSGRYVYANRAFSGLEANGRLLEAIREVAALSETIAGGQACLITSDAGRQFQAQFVRFTVEEDSRVGVVTRWLDTPTMKANPEQRIDPLTRLPDRNALVQRLTAALNGNRAADRRVAVVFLDLDQFKRINDEFGHLVGDTALREVAVRIADCVRDGDQVFRFGGDEFVAVLADVANACEVEPVIGRIRSALAKPIPLPDSQMSLTVSVGIALASDDYQSVDELLAAADRGMYLAKRDGGLTA